MIKKIFDEIATEPGSNKKMEILSSYKDNKTLKEVLYLANSPRVKFYIKQIPEYTSDNSGSETLQWALEGLKSLISREYTGHKAISWLNTILSALSSDDAYILERIIEKDCKIGMGTSNINKIFPKLIEETPYMGAKAFEEKLARKIFENDGFGYSQVKMDGRYCNAVISDGNVLLESRQGEPTIVTGAIFLEELAKFEDCVLNGELTMDGKERYESNGIIASIIDITGKVNDRTEAETNKKKAAFVKEHGSFEDALSKIRFTVWDSIKLVEYSEAKSTRPYSNRLSEVDFFLNKYKPTMISKVETRVVKSYEEAMSHFQETLSRKLEGTILKSSDGTWKDGKPNWQVKMKLEIDVDLKIVGFNLGTGKNAQVISSLNAESSCGKVFTKPTGMNEAMMKHVTENQDKLINTIVEVKCCGLSKDSSGNYALLHPVFKALRDDKNTCDSLESIEKIESMAKSLSK